MSSFTPSNGLRGATLSTPLPRRRRRNNLPPPPSVKCNLPSSSHDPNSSRRSDFLKTLSKTVAISSAAAILFNSGPLRPFLPTDSGIGGNGGTNGG